MAGVRRLHTQISFEPRVTFARVLPLARLNDSGTFETEDEVVIGLENITPGSRLELVNRSTNPRAQFERDAVTFDVRLTPSGEGRVHLDAHQMRELELEPGDLLSLRILTLGGESSPSMHFVLVRKGPIYAHHAVPM